MKWTTIWIKVFGTTEFLGLNMGFWIAIIAVVLIVILMNLVFWRMKPMEPAKSKN